jgi:hypothetical protein
MTCGLEFGADLELAPAPNVTGGCGKMHLAALLN